MMIYSLVVEGLIFAQADIFGEYLPTKSSIEAVLSKLRNPNRTKGEKRIAEQDFCTFSYAIVTLLDRQLNADIYLSRGETGEDLEASFQLVSAIKKQAEMTGFSFWSLMQSTFVMRWYHYLAGNPSGGNLQKIHQQTTSMLSIANGEKEPWNFPEATIYDDYSRLEEYSDFKSSTEYFKSFTSKVINDLENSLNEQNPKERGSKIGDSILDMYAAINSLAAIYKKKGNRLVPFLCPFCQSHSLLKRANKGSRAHCEKLECKRAYSFVGTQRNRESPANQIQVSSLRPWEKASGTPRYCCECRKRRLVNKERSCKPCYYLEP